MAADAFVISAVNLTIDESLLRTLVRFFATVSSALCVIVAVVYGLTQGNWLRGALAGLALAISMTPEEFPVVLTVFLALGAWRISKKHVLTRRVPAIEMLGAATVLCVDKTGTLTMNRMSVREVRPAPGHDRASVLRAAMLASAEKPFDPMERALHEAALEHGAALASAPIMLIHEYPLSSALLVMSRVLKIGGEDQLYVFAKGAPEAIAQVCGIPSNEIAPSIQAMAGLGLRVLGVARARG